MNLIFLLLLIVFDVSLAGFTPKDVKCGVCRATVEEMMKAIDKVNPNKKIQVGGFRVDETGQLQEKLVPFARSGMHLSELMDEICGTMDEYVRATDKTTGELRVLRLVLEGGSMNPDISNYDIVQDSDLNKSLGFYCEGIVEEFEDEIYNGLREPLDDPVMEICTKATNLCSSEDKDEL